MIVKRGPPGGGVSGWFCNNSFCLSLGVSTTPPPPVSYSS